MDKKEFRKEALRLRDALPKDKRREWSSAICKRALCYVQENHFSVIAVYASFRSEPETGGLISELLKMGKTVCLPKCQKDSVMDMIPILSLLDVKSGAYGIPEPVGEAISPEKIDLVLVPGCAFGKDMSRMGYGGGYYDRYLPKCKNAKKIGLCFEASVQEKVPRDQTDVFMDAFITEERLVNNL